MSLIRKAATAASAAVLAASAGLAIAAAPASATTLTCTNVAGATAAPIGCGGDQLAYTGKGTLDLGVLGSGNGIGAVPGNYWNSPVGFLTDSTSNAREDFTVFAVNGSVSDGPGGLGEYVVMYTPDGVIPTTGGAAQPVIGTSFKPWTDDYCLSVENLDNGPKGALRWHTVLRNCNTNGSFEYGTNTSTSPADNEVSSSFANKYQVWAPVSGPDGLVLLNESLSHGFKSGNTPYVLDDTRFGGSGTQALAYPENDGLNQQSVIIGCTDPIKGLEAELPTGYYNCP